MSPKILVIGSANMDFAMNVSRVPAAGETLIDDGGVAYTPGGKGANSALALKKLGADCVFCTRLGADLHGQKLFNFYKESGIDTSTIKVDHDFPTGLAVVMKEGDGQNRIVVYPGANQNITADSIAEAMDCQPDAIYLCFEIPFTIAATVARMAAARHIPVFVDAAPASTDYPLDTLAPVEIFSPNESETETYTGILPSGAESSMRAALMLYRKVKCRYVVIKQGGRGACLYDGKRLDMIPAFRADKVVDTTAAGDAFTAALTVEYMRNGGDIKAAIRYGAAAGAITVSRKGASVSIPTEEEVRAFLARQHS